MVCYLYANLELIIIFCTLLQKNKYLKRYILANIMIVLLFFSQSWRFADLKIAAIERRRIMGLYKHFFFYIIIFFILIIKFRNFYFLNHFIPPRIHTDYDYSPATTLSFFIQKYENNKINKWSVI